MSNLKAIVKQLHDNILLGVSGKFGLDDADINTIAERLDGIDCGIENDELRAVADKFDNLPDEKKQEIIYAIVERKMYEESICRKYGISRATMYRWMKQGRLPKEFHRDGEGRQFLYESECDEALAKWNTCQISRDGRDR